jgi:hypothetical protein
MFCHHNYRLLALLSCLLLRASNFSLPTSTLHYFLIATDTRMFYHHNYRLLALLSCLLLRASNFSLPNSTYSLLSYCHEPACGEAGARIFYYLNSCLMIPNSFLFSSYSFLIFSLPRMHECSFIITITSWLYCLASYFALPASLFLLLPFTTFSLPRTRLRRGRCTNILPS